MEFKLDESLRGASDEALLEDMRRSAKVIGRDTINYCPIRGNRESPSMYYSAKIWIVAKSLKTCRPATQQFENWNYR